MKIALFFLIVTSYFYFRKVWFNYRKIRAVSSIEKITLQMFKPDIILPEVEVEYKYYSQQGVYFGRGLLHLSSFIGSDTFVFYLNEHNLPVLETGEDKFVTEEQIEHFLLSRYNSLIIFIDPVEPFHSTIDCINQNYIEVPNV